MEKTSLLHFYSQLPQMASLNVKKSGVCNNIVVFEATVQPLLALKEGTSTGYSALFFLDLPVELRKAFSLILRTLALGHFKTLTCWGKSHANQQSFCLHTAIVLPLTNCA